MAGRTVARRVWPYDAFISYSHAADRQLAIEIQRHLHRLGRPWYRTQALRVFRDGSSLAASPDLWGSIENTLTRSRCFILLACPQAAQSEWVRREIAFWQEHRDPKTFLIGLTGGQIRWDPVAGDFDWARTDALPEQLSGWFKAEPLWADLHWIRQLGGAPNGPALRDGSATLAAAVHGVPKDRLDGEDLRQRRRARTALVFLMVVLLALTGGVAYALHLRNRQHEIAVAGDLHARAETLRDRQPQMALRLDLAAYAIDPTSRAWAGLITTLTRTQYAGGTPAPTNKLGVSDLLLDSIGFSGDGQLAVGGGGWAVAMWDITDPLRAARLPDLSPDTRYANEATVSPDGRTVAIANRDDTVSLWNIGDHSQPRQIPSLRRATGATYGVDGVAFSHDGRTLAAAGSGDNMDGTVTLWDVGDPARPRLLARRDGVYDSESVAFSPDDRLLVSASGVVTARGSAGPPAPEDIVHTTGVTLWDIRVRTRPTPLARMPSWSRGITFSPNGRLLALGRSETTMLWDVTTPSRPREAATLRGHTDMVWTSAFSADGRTLATGDADGQVILWNVADPGRPRQLDTLSNGSRLVAGIRFDPDGRHLLTVDHNGTIASWRVRGPGQVPRVATLPTGTGSQRPPMVAVDPDGRTVASADGFARTVTVWDVDKPQRPTRLTTLRPGLSTVQVVAFSADGKTLAAGGTNGRIALWDMADRKDPRPSGTITAPSQVATLAFAPRSTVLAAGGSTTDFGPGWVTFWDVRDATRPVQVTSFSTGSGPLVPAFAPDGRTLVLGSSLWNLDNPSAPVRVSADDAPVSLGDLPAFSPDGRTLATVSDKGVDLWAVTETRPRHLAQLASQNQTVRRAVFAPDGKLVATVSDDRTAVLWDVADPGRPVPVATLNGHTGSLVDVAFGPDGRWLVTAGGDSTIGIWELGDLPDVVATDPVELACRVAGGGLTVEQWSEYAADVSYRDQC